MAYDIGVIQFMVKWAEHADLKDQALHLCTFLSLCRCLSHLAGSYCRVGRQLQAAHTYVN